MDSGRRQHHTRKMAPSASGPGFAKFFPNAPRATREKAAEREREKSRASESKADRDARIPTATSTSQSAQQNGIKSEPSVSSDAAHLPTDDNESLQGDILNVVGSASSHASTTSSVFSHGSAMNTATHASNSNSTPLTNSGSPSNPSTTTTSKSQHSKQPQDARKYNDSISASATDSSSTPRRTGTTIRVPARDPTRQTQGMKRTYDPLLDKKLSSTERKTTKPTYKPFGAVRNLYYNIYESGRGTSSDLV